MENAVIDGAARHEVHLRSYRRLLILQTTRLHRGETDYANPVQLENIAENDRHRCQSPNSNIIVGDYPESRCSWGTRHQVLSVRRRSLVGRDKIYYEQYSHILPNSMQIHEST
jgi:hypothetical protein